MKKGSKKLAASARARESSTPDVPVFAIPLPAGVTPVVAEEARDVPSFTPREQQVGGWLAEGKSDPEIAGILNVGRETVRTHIKTMREKVGVYSRNTLFAWIWRNRVAAHAAASPGRKEVKYK